MIPDDTDRGGNGGKGGDVGEATVLLELLLALRKGFLLPAPGVEAVEEMGMVTLRRAGPRGFPD
jgi:hypothetical protein